MKKILKTFYFEFFERRFENVIRHEEIVLNNYMLVRWIKKQDRDNLYSVGIFIRGNQKVIAKILRYNHQNLSYIQLKNEICSIKLLSSILKINKKYSVPKIIKISDRERRVILVTEYIAGNTTDNYSSESNFEILNNLLNFFSNINLGKKKDLLSKNYPILLFIAIFYYTLIALFKNFSAYKQIINLSLLYLANISIFDLFRPKYEVSHKDLHPKNLIVRNGKIVLIDTEYLSLSPKFTDISISLRHFSDILTPAQLVATLNNFIHSEKDFKAFITLSSFYTLQILAVDSKGGIDYEKAIKYFDSLKEMNALMNKNRILFAGVNITN